MDILSKEEARFDKARLVSEIEKGKIILHPTDTIYGLGCSAINEGSVRKLRELKNNDSRPFSVIAPSKEWILDNCEIDEKDKDWLDRLPGPFTLILKLKNKNSISKHVNSGLDTIGVRMPEHWISEMVEELGVPFITTAALVEGNRVIINPNETSQEYRKSVHYAIDEGDLNGIPSTIVDLSSKKVLINER
ncbi:MAG TPA: L-threonylcarbamoyladenylate synthase [Candidatus Woesearchaeota archaeon]|nr:L-threonylcarbamoyladenylate synthase [Candidatus Woesearchaeota archaeon]